MSLRSSIPNIYWFIPSAGDGRKLGAPTRPAHFAYLSSIAQAADSLGFDGVLLPTGGFAEDTIVTASALITQTRHLRFLVALRPGLISPVLAARISVSLDRISQGRVHLNVVSGSGNFDGEGVALSQAERYELTREWLEVFVALLHGEEVTHLGRHLKVVGGRAYLPSVQRPYPDIYFAGSSQPALEVAGDLVDVYLSWGERPSEVAEKIATVKQRAAAVGRKVRFGLRAHIIVRESEEQAWREAEALIADLSEAQIQKAQQGFAASASEGQRRMARLHNGSRADLKIGKNLWAGVGLVRGGAGTAFVGNPENIAAAMREYTDLGIDTFILSGYPHLEEAYQTAELLFPALGKTSPVFQTQEEATEKAVVAAGSATIGRFSSI